MDLGKLEVKIGVKSGWIQMGFGGGDRLGNETQAVTIDEIQQKLEGIDDAVNKKMIVSGENVSILYFSSLVDHLRFHETVIVPLFNGNGDLTQVSEEVKPANLHTILTLITTGHTILFFPERNLYLKVNTYSPPMGAIEESDTESTIAGPRNSFTEAMQTNISLIKRRIHNSGLKSEEYRIGLETNTKATVLYMEHLVNKNNLEKVVQRLLSIRTTGINDINELSQLMEESQFSPFPQFHNTERPDSVATSLLDGRIIILLDNSQTALICPSSFFEFFTSPEDQYSRWPTATLLRCIRFFGFFLTIMLTPFYISALSHHPEMLPFEVLINLQESRSRVPFPPVIEVLFMEIVIEVLREAGSRMPTKIGQTIGIVGGIVIGTAAVEAGLVSNTLIVLVAISALLSFLPPSFVMSNTSRIIRYIFILSAGLFGLYGQMIAFAWLIHHLITLTSNGTPYMAPVIPRKWTDLLDGVFRAPLTFSQHRKGISGEVENKTLPMDGEE